MAVVVMELRVVKKLFGIDLGEIGEIEESWSAAARPLPPVGGSVTLAAYFRQSLHPATQAKAKVAAAVA
jgi:hypothetical protein